MLKIVVILTKISKGELMKSLTILAIAALTSTSALALDTAIGLKGRFDYIHTETETTPGSKTSSGILTPSYLKLVTDSKINDTTNAKLTLNFQQNSTLDNNVQNLVDEAYITKKAGDFSVIIGKQSVLTGGRENDYSGSDIYLYSRFLETFGYYFTGVSAGYTQFGQNFYLQYLEQSDSTSTPLTDKKVIGAAYYGDLLDKKIMPIISYHKFGTSRAGSYNNVLSVGLRFNIEKFLIEGDYLVNELEKLSAEGDAKITSVVTHVRYIFDQGFQPFAKFITEKGKKGFTGIVSGSSESERKAFEVGLEYFPSKDEDFRYHVVYNNSDSKQTSPSTTKVEEQKLYAGIMFNYNLLK